MKRVTLLTTLAIFGLTAVTGYAQVNPPAATTSAPARSVPTQVTPTPESRTQALKLAQALNGEELTRRQINRLYTVIMPAAIKQKAEYQEMEKVYPGISDIAIQAEREIIEPASMARLPQMHQAIADVYAQYLTSDDMDAISAFYATSTGMKALVAAAEGTDFSHMVEKNLASEDSKVEASDIKTMVMGHTAKFLSILDDEDRRKLVAFGLSPAGRKWGGIQRLVLEATANHANQGNAEVIARATENVIKAMTDFVNKSDQARTAKK
ncbi:DUF2059 domain-containing protein [Sphingobium sp. AN641]|uniref:DUF2059 domain-containing protein n=1 Tax=Sphingobium sp. AN641 TaxID=3133443 RepID=UPI0030BCC6BA